MLRIAQRVVPSMRLPSAEFLPPLQGIDRMISAWNSSRIAKPSNRTMCALASLSNLNTSEGNQQARNEIAVANALKDGYSPRASYSRWARNQRLRAALDATREGSDFVIPRPEKMDVPGPCGAVMNVLRLLGPLRTDELWEAVSQRYPGVVSSKNHLKKHVLRDHLRNKLVKVNLLTSTKLPFSA